MGYYKIWCQKGTDIFIEKDEYVNWEISHWDESVPERWHVSIGGVVVEFEVEPSIYFRANKTDNWKEIKWEDTYYDDGYARDYDD